MNISYIWRNRYKKFLDNPKAVIPFFKKRLYYNFIADRQLKHYKDFHYLNYTETIDYIVDNNKSIVRFGDDLFDMFQGIGLYYNNWHQKYNSELAKKLKEIINSKEQNLLICFNPEFILLDKKGFKKQNIPEQYHFWTNSKIFLKDYYHRDVIYGSALCFTPRYNKNINYEKIKNFFIKRNIIIVTSNTQRFQNLKLGKTTDFIESPENDSWNKFEGIKEKTITLAKKFGKNDTLILISMGPTAKVLVYDLAILGYTAWDTGQFFDLAFREIQKINN